jgi:hypothetical protein
MSGLRSCPNSAVISVSRFTEQIRSPKNISLMHLRFLASFVLLAANLFAQMMEGELRLTFRDPQGNAVPARVELDSRNPPFHAAAQANSAGVARLGRLPLGVYRLTVAQPGLRTYEETVEVRSAVPQARTITLQLEVVATTLTVTQPVPLLDRSQPALLMQQGQNELDETLGTTLGRSTIDVVTTLPGWLLEANAVLHPRGSEYDTQYVIDGMPLYDNRSIGFAPPFENQEFSAVSVLTAGIPAEYGRRLGGVIALDTRRRDTLGSTSDLQFQSGSYGTNSGALLAALPDHANRRVVGAEYGHDGPLPRPAVARKLHQRSQHRRYERPAGPRPDGARPPVAIPTVEQDELSRPQRSGTAGSRPAPGPAIDGNGWPSALSARVFGTDRSVCARDGARPHRAAVEQRVLHASAR